MELKLIHLILIAIFLIVSALGAANKRRMEHQDPSGGDGDSTATPKREGMTLAEWIEELRRQAEARGRPSGERPSAPRTEAADVVDEEPEEAPEQVAEPSIERPDPEPVRARVDESYTAHRPRDIDVATSTTPEYSGRKMHVATGVPVDRTEKIRHPLRAALTRDGVKRALILSEVLSQPVSRRPRGRGQVG